MTADVDARARRSDDRGPILCHQGSRQLLPARPRLRSNWVNWAGGRKDRTWVVLGPYLSTSRLLPKKIGGSGAKLCHHGNALLLRGLLSTQIPRQVCPWRGSQVVLIPGAQMLIPLKHGSRAPRAPIAAAWHRTSPGARWSTVTQAAVCCNALPSLCGYYTAKKNVCSLTWWCLGAEAHLPAALLPFSSPYPCPGGEQEGGHSPSGSLCHLLAPGLMQALPQTRSYQSCGFSSLFFLQKHP